MRLPTTKILGVPLAGLLSLTSACLEPGETFDGDQAEFGLDEDDQTAAEHTPVEALDQGEGEVSSLAPETVGLRHCTQDNDCRTNSCYCGDGNTCEVRLIGPLPPAGYCDLEPVRACSSSADCQDGCWCGGGQCVAGGPGPLNSACYLPPPDAYEYDDTWQARSSYTGPQRHNFGYDGDADWVAVYILEPGLVRFRTHSLTNQADTKLKVFAYDGVTKGALLGINDDIGGPWYWPDSHSSRVDIQVPGDAAYLIKVVDRSPASVYTDSLQFPEYSLELSYL